MDHSNCRSKAANHVLTPLPDNLIESAFPCQHNDEWHTEIEGIEVRIDEFVNQRIESEAIFGFMKALMESSA